MSTPGNTTSLVTPGYGYGGGHTATGLTPPSQRGSLLQQHVTRLPTPSALASPSFNQAANDDMDEEEVRSPSHHSMHAQFASVSSGRGLHSGHSIEMPYVADLGQASVRPPQASIRRAQVAPFSGANSLASKAIKSATAGLFSLRSVPPIDKLPPLPPPLRIAVVGSAKVGKTQIINRFLTGMYDRNYVKTSKIDIGLKLYQTAHPGHAYQLEIWDIPANPKMEDMLRDAYLPQMDGAMIVTDSTDLKSFQHIRKWADLFTETQVGRLVDNLAALGAEDDVILHSLPGPDGRPTLVSTFPVLLFANKSDSDRCSLSQQDILESASHFKLSYGVLGSALVNKPLNHGGASIMPPGATVSPAIAATAAQLAALNPADSGIEQAFQLLLGELARFQHLRATTVLGQATLGPQGVATERVDPPAGAAGVENSLHSVRPASGMMSKRFLASQPAMPLPASLASLRVKPNSSRTSTAFSFATPPAAVGSPVAPAKPSLLAAARARQAAEDAKAEEDAEEAEEEEPVEEEEEPESEEEEEEEEEDAEEEEEEEDEEEEEEDEEDESEEGEEEEEEEEVAAEPAAEAEAEAEPAS